MIWLCACTVHLNEEPELSHQTDTINGLCIVWQRGITDSAKIVITDIVNDLVHVDGGFFVMGADLAYDDMARENETPAHLVKLSDYYIMAHEMTYDQVITLVGKDERVLANSLHYTYDDWIYIVKLLHEMTGLSFSIPTEAQWEYAARGGAASKGYLYPGSNDRMAVWTGDKNNPSTTPNELGLYNMADSYSEWCLDAYYEYENMEIQEDPCEIVYDLTANAHVVRGGCYESSQKYKYWMTMETYHSSYEDKRMCRSTARAYGYANSANSGIVCRMVVNSKK